MRYWPQLLTVALIGAFYMTTKSRAERNNNPLNIEYNPRNKWVGQTGVEGKGRFAVFSEPIYGFRAALKLFDTYQKKYGINTLYELIHRWAPPTNNDGETENDTDNYVKFVSSRTGLDPHDFIDRSAYADIAHAMAKMESGKEWDIEQIRAAQKLV